MKKWTISLFLAVLAALLIYIPVNNLHNQYNLQSYKESRTQAREHLNYIRDDLQSKLDNSLFYADFFEMIISQNPGITENDLREYSQLIIERNKLVDSVSLARNGIIHFIYPLKGNEEALGHDLMDDPDRKEYLEEAIQKREAVAQGPIEAIQGGMKIFNRKPVFIQSVSSEDVWGFANVTIDFDKLIESSLLYNHLPKYHYALKIETDGTSPLLWGQKSVFDDEAVTASITLPENLWTLALVPSGGWDRNQVSHSLDTLISYVFILIVFILVLFFVHQYLTKRELSRMDALTRLLNKKTFELSVKKVLKYSTKKNGLLLIDFNDFKLINDTHGHLVGDKVLVITAERLIRCLKKGDLIGRIGGDEIMIFVKDIKSEDELKSIKQRIIERIEKQILIENKIIQPSISIGHILISQWVPFDHIYDIVDKKMYVHKTAKKVVNVH